MDKESENELKNFSYVRANETTLACECWNKTEEQKRQCWKDFDKIK